LLTDNPQVRTAYALGKARLAARAHVSIDTLAATLYNHVYHDITELYDPETFTVRPPTQWPKALRECVEEITVIEPSQTSGGHVKVKFVSRQAALKMLAEYKGMFDRSSGRPQQQLILDLSLEPHVTIHQQRSGTEHLAIDLTPDDAEEGWGSSA
jgi:hypothetical protein